jgi:hypothetical protein
VTYSEHHSVNPMLAGRSFAGVMPEPPAVESDNPNNSSLAIQQ